MISGWERLGRQVKSRRARQGFTSARDLAQAAGVGYRTIQIIESGHHTGQPREQTLMRLDRALGWEEGSCLRIVEGGRPREARDPLLQRVLGVWHQLAPDDQVRIAEEAESRARR